MEEAVQTAEIGIGESKTSLSLLGESYLEARRAMEVGHIFSPEETIHVFRNLLLERFLMNVPREESIALPRLALQPQNGQTF